MRSLGYDLGEETANVSLTMSHVAARQELRDLVVVLKLPGFDGDPLRF